MTPEQGKLLGKHIEHAKTKGLPCLFCDRHTNDVIGFGSYDGELATALGAAPTKNRGVVYTVCTSCASHFKTEQDFAEACDKQIFEKFVQGTRQ